MSAYLHCTGLGHCLSARRHHLCVFIFKSEAATQLLARLLKDSPSTTSPSALHHHHHHPLLTTEKDVTMFYYCL